ncbi:MAG: GyrI-like domain-containing protein [Clostridiales bacterium]|nr:GyrI-like domain-containing protein [Clostridiales bacterium]
MSEIIKSYRQHIPTMRFIGKTYGDSDRVDGTFGAKWSEFFQNGWFQTLEKLSGAQPGEVFEDADAYLGLMRCKKGEPFEYRIGMLLPRGTEVPDGFDCVDFPESTLGVCWVYGKESEIYMQEEICGERLKSEGMSIAEDKDGAIWFFERYACPRFTRPDEKGNIILDICFIVK